MGRPQAVHPKFAKGEDRAPQLASGLLRLRAWAASYTHADYRRVRRLCRESSDCELTDLIRHRSLLSARAARALDAVWARRTRCAATEAHASGADPSRLPTDAPHGSRWWMVRRVVLVFVVWTLILQLYRSGSPWFWVTVAACLGWGAALFFWPEVVSRMRNRLGHQRRTTSKTGAEPDASIHDVTGRVADYRTGRP